MASFEETVVDDACAIESLTKKRTCSFGDSCAGSESSAFSLTFVVADSAEFADSLTTSLAFLFYDAAEAIDSATGKHSATFTDAAAAEDAAILSTLWTLNDAGVATDSTELSDLIFTFLDTIVAESTVVAKRTVLDAIYDTALLTETFGPVKVLTVEDAVEALETIAPRLRVTALDTGVGTEAVIAKRTSFTTLVDAATASEALSRHLVSVATIVDALIVADVIHTTPEELRSAYWTNPRTTAAARWDALSVNSIVEIDGRVFGATPEGIVELALDEGTVDARIVWDLLDFGAAEEKKAQAAYVAGDSTKPFKVTVTTKQGSWDYTTHLVDGSEQAENHYTPLGRGLLARYYRFALSNTEGAPFSMNELRALIGSGTRRRGG